MDTIFLEDLQVDTVIGIYDWERQIRQVVSLDLEMSADIRRAAATDQVSDTLDYKRVAKRLIQYVSQSRFELIETLIERVAQIILYEFGVSSVKVRLCKPGAVRFSKTVGIEIERKREPGDSQMVYVSIGSNVRAEQNLSSALAMLRNEFPGLERSSVYRNPAVGFAGEDFLNAVVQFPSCLPPDLVAERLVWIENVHGRDREQAKFSPRSLDLDLLLYGQQVLDQGKLKLPREDITRYAFVLGPLAELVPGLEHPQRGKTIQALWSAFPDKSGLTKIEFNEGDS